MRRSCSKKGLGGLLRQCEIRPNKINRLEKFPATHDSLGVVPFSEPNTYNLIMKLPDTDCLDLLPEDYTYGPLTLLRTILPLAFKQISVTKRAIALLWQDVDGYGSWECHDAWYQRIWIMGMPRCLVSNFRRPCSKICYKHTIWQAHAYTKRKFIDRS